MSQTLKLPNYASLNLLEPTKLTADAAAAQAVLVVENNHGFAEDNYFLLGVIGGERAEILQVTSVSGATGITAASNLTKPHNKFEPVTKLFGNQIKVYRAANVNGTQPADGSFSSIATIDLDRDHPQTEYTDSTGGADYWYKFTYYNSDTTGESSLADSQAVRGGGVGNYASIESIRKEAGLTNSRWVTDPDVDEKRQAAQQEINSRLAGMYTLPFTEPINPLIAEITRKLAAGFLLLKNYGPQTTVTTNDGQAKVDEARALLGKLDTKELVLTDASGTDTSIAGTGAGFTGWPNASTATAADNVGGGERKFRVSDRY